MSKVRFWAALLIGVQGRHWRRARVLRGPTNGYNQATCRPSFFRPERPKLAILTPTTFVGGQ